MNKSVIKLVAIVFASLLALPVNANPKMKQFSFPEFGFSIYFPKETKKKEENKDIVDYFFQQFDTSGKNIGTARFTIYPNFHIAHKEEVLQKFNDLIKNEKVGDSFTPGKTTRTVHKGFQELISINSEYQFKNEKFTIKREDYLFISCNGLVAISFLVPSYNCYITADERQWIVNSSMSWFEKDGESGLLGLKYDIPKGILKKAYHDDKKGLTFISCVEDYKSEIEIRKLDYKESDFAKASEMHFAESKKITKYFDWYNMKPAILKRESTAYLYRFNVKDIQYEICEYLIRSEGIYYSVKVISTCTDLDGCGSFFMAQSERFIDTIQTVAQKVDDDDFWYEW